MERLTGQELLKATAESKVVNGEIETKYARDAIKWGSIVTVILCIVMTILELVIAHRWNVGMVTVLMAFAGSADFYEGKKASKRIMLIKGIVEIVLAALFALLFVGLLFI